MIQPARRRMVNDSLIARNFRMATVLVWDHGLGQTLQESADLCNATGSPMFLLTKVGFSPTPGGDFPLRDKHVTYLSGVAVEG